MVIEIGLWLEILEVIKLFNVAYLAEKALAAKKGAEEILSALERNDPGSPSYVVDGVLRLEDALGSLHVGARQLLQDEHKEEKDYMLRHMGQVVKGE